MYICDMIHPITIMVISSVIFYFFLVIFYLLPIYCVPCVKAAEGQCQQALPNPGADTSASWSDVPRGRMIRIDVGKLIWPLLRHHI